MARKIRDESGDSLEKTDDAKVAFKTSDSVFMPVRSLFCVGNEGGLLTAVSQKWARMNATAIPETIPHPQKDSVHAKHISFSYRLTLTNTISYLENLVEIG